MDFIELDLLVNTILPCLEQHAEGRNETTRRRRFELVRFFHYCTLYSGSEVSAEFTFDHLLGLLERSTEALETLCQQTSVHDELAQAVYDEVDQIWQFCSEAAGKVCDHFDNHATKEAESTVATALKRIFNWHEPSHLRAMIYVYTQELLENGLLEKERSLLKTAFKKCLAEDPS